MSADMAVLTADLAAESAELYEVLSVLAEADWARDTPAAGWTVRDQVTHLAFFDDAAVEAATDPGRFAARELVDDDPDRVAERHRGLTGAEAFAWLQRARRAYLEVFAALDPGTKLPWYGPPMSAASSVTARLMETWAHGQDVFDALGLTRRPTARLRHVAHLGVRTLGWSFAVRGLPVPDAPVRVELTGPDGGVWTWGPADAADRVTGPAEDFCLLVVQRRHRAGTALVATGPVADRWLDVAQAFAGPPGPGRAQVPA
ncbi:TIGR03084 family metal-binding protein [Geodermatophilus sp. SYSU D00815]